MSAHHNGLDPEAAELLAVLAEECGEVVQRIGKVLRHGLESRNPYTGTCNRESLTDELTDVFTVTRLLHGLGVVHMGQIELGMPAKLERLARPGMLHHSTLLSPVPCVLCGSVTELQEGPVGAGRCIDQRSCRTRTSASGT